MTLLLRITLEMLVLGGAAPPLALALGSGRWHRAGALGSPAVGLAALTGILAAVQSPAVVEAASRSWALSALTLLAFLTAAVLFWWIRKEPAARYRALSWIAPLLFIPPFLLYLFVMRWWTGSTAPLTDTLIFYGVLVLLVGYAYVVLIHAGRRALDRWGAIATTPAGL